MKRLIVIILFFCSTILLGQDVKVENEYYPNKSIKKELTSQEGNEKSYLKNFYQNGKLKSQGWLLNGKKDLYWIYYFEDGRTKSKGGYEQNKKN